MCEQELWIPDTRSLLWAQMNGVVGVETTVEKGGWISLEMEALFEEFGAETYERVPVLRRAFARSHGKKIGELWTAPVAAKAFKRNAGKWVSGDAKKKFGEYCTARDKELRKAALVVRKAKDELVCVRVRNMVGKELALYHAVAKIFADGIVEEYKIFKSGAKRVPGLVCKWAPTEKHMHDRATLMVDAIIEQMPAGSLVTR